MEARVSEKSMGFEFAWSPNFLELNESGNAGEG